MRLASFIKDDTASYGIVTDDGIIDAGGRLGSHLPTLRQALQDLDQVAALGGEAADFALEDVQLLPPIPHPRRLVCIGVNYRKHVEEVGHEVPDYPSIFARCIDSVVGHGADVVRPTASNDYDFEGELAFVISQGGRHIPAERAYDHVAGYTCFLDGSIRDYQFHTPTPHAGKNFWRSGACGPWMVTRDAVPEPADLTLTTRLNGQVMQESGIGDLIFGVPQLIAYLSTIAPLYPGDIVSTGTPSGVGLAREPQVWMQSGDNIEIEITGIGILKNPVVDEADTT
ncbi:MAG: fumarylacetoacetate hydrolase family protein [Alphaproteobacteria bacterium]|jgi:2-keto-4-pentenoate hydratase/2-oxohepta-3-ene-1,7-dioic acid hydratase in catechol pathway|nr:fumarylacetoacetate hydrolase family protein [Alphaproteobacteria bacterium]